MRYVITHLKAPWPLGAVVGDVLDVQALPIWAVGKCAVAPEDAEVTVELAEVLPPEAPEDKAAVMAQHFREQAQAAIDQAAEAHALAQGELQASLIQAQDAINELRAALESSEAKVAELQAKLDAPVTDEDKAATALQEADAQAEAERKAIEAKTPAKGKGK